MSVYSSKQATLDASQSAAYEKISNLGSYQAILDSMPEELRKQAGDVHFTDDSVIINATPVGEMRFDVTRRQAPDTVELTAANAPVPMKLSLNLTPGESADSCMLRTDIDIDIPAIMRPMVGGKMQEAAQQMTDLVARIFNAHKA
ncbi:MAG: hypothetical protein NC187_05475 [Candidatus Amulumruptor caecigallinarius]|nr:hypothetical protein [Candidatus Amulumruptor caecigallinarius]MCM1396919.1 hypothetical protein [Candidatus Amulumruptor caecigallinarius]MCM1454137.1 hypothetical protein [bacterium]